MSMEEPETLAAFCAKQYLASAAPQMGNTPTTCQTKNGWRTDDHK